MKKNFLLLLLICFVFHILTGCESAESKALKESTANFNNAVNEVNTLYDNLTDKISEGEGLLLATKGEELADASLLEKLQSEIDSAKELTVDVPDIATDAAQVSQQIQDIDSQKNKIQAQYDSLSSTISTIETEKAEQEHLKKETLEGVGIIAVKYESGTNGQAITLTCIDPVTGENQVVRSFSSVGKNFDIEELPSSPLWARQRFDSKFKKVAVTTKPSSDGSTHVGWLTDTGNYFDITNITADERTDFSSPILHNKGRFGPEDYFYYYDAKQQGGLWISSQDITIMRIPSSNPTKDLLEAMDDDVGTNTYYVQPNGIPEDGTSIFPMSDSTGEWYASGATTMDWIDTTTYIAVSSWEKDSTIYKKKALQVKDIWGHETHKILPEIKDRRNWNGIVSPDGNQIAFLSKINTGTEPPELFIVSSSGGEPVKVPTDYYFDESTLQLLIWK